jgi:hypothetical protein
MQYAGDALREDKELMLIAVNSYAYAYRYIGDSLLEDEDIRQVYLERFL